MAGVSAFLGMGGYAAFVWPALALTVAVMVGLVLQSLRALRARERELSALGETPERARPSLSR